MSRSNQVAIVIDLGGTNICGAVINSDNHIIRRLKHKTNTGDCDATVEQIVELIDILKRQVNNTIAGVGIAAVAGAIDHERGVLLETANLHFPPRFPLKKVLQGIFNLPIHIGSEIKWRP